MADQADSADQVDLVLVDQVAKEAKGKAAPEAALQGDRDSEERPNPKIHSTTNPKKSETHGDCSIKDSNAPTTD